MQNGRVQCALADGRMRTLKCQQCRPYREGSVRMHACHRCVQRVASTRAGHFGAPARPRLASPPARAILGAAWGHFLVLHAPFSRSSFWFPFSVYSGMPVAGRLVFQPAPRDSQAYAGPQLRRDTPQDGCTEV